MQQRTEQRSSGLLAVLLLVSSLTLFFQLFPGIWWTIVSVVDVRKWTWLAWSGYFTVAIAVLILLKARHENSD